MDGKIEVEHQMEGELQGFFWTMQDFRSKILEGKIQARFNRKNICW